jgi:hypothetical protein
VSRRRGRDGRPIPTVDLASEYLEVERRRYHEQIRSEPSTERVLEEAAPRFRDKGWRVTEKEVR